MAEKDDGLGLRLSLRCPENHPPTFPMNLPSMFNGHKSSLNDSFQFSSERTREHDVGLTRSYLRGIDVNRRPTWTADCEEEVGVSSPNSTVSSVSGKRSEREENKSERGWTTCSHSGASDEEEGGAGGEAGIRKKLRLSKDQAAVLEETFKEQKTLNPKEKVALAKQLNLRPRQVEVWFQNRRARTKLKQTEVDCEYLKMCCDNLTAENRRLQKEVNELRALKLSPKSYLHMNPPTTLTMCPACQRVAVLPKSSAAAAAAAAAATTSGITRHLNAVAPAQLQRPTPITALPFKSHNPLAK